MIALALDPGKTTGWCRAVLDGDELSLYATETMFSLDSLYEFMHDFMRMGGPAHVIYEDFQYRNQSRKGLDLTPVKMIAIIELFAERYAPLVSFTKQSAATGKAFWSDDKLKARGAYKKGKPHARDATRHMLQWLSFGYGSQFINVNKIDIVMS